MQNLLHANMLLLTAKYIRISRSIRSTLYLLFLSIIHTWTKGKTHEKEPERSVTLEQFIRMVEYNYCCYLYSDFTIKTAN